MKIERDNPKVFLWHVFICFAIVLTIFSTAITHIEKVYYWIYQKTPEYRFGKLVDDLYYRIAEITGNLSYMCHDGTNTIINTKNKCFSITE